MPLGMGYGTQRKRIGLPMAGNVAAANSMARRFTTPQPMQFGSAQPTSVRDRELALQQRHQRRRIESMGSVPTAVSIGGIPVDEQYPSSPNRPYAFGSQFQMLPYGGRVDMYGPPATTTSPRSMSERGPVAPPPMVPDRQYSNQIAPLSSIGYAQGPFTMRPQAGFRGSAAIGYQSSDQGQQPVAGEPGMLYQHAEANRIAGSGPYDSGAGRARFGSSVYAPQPSYQVGVDERVAAYRAAQGGEQPRNFGVSTGSTARISPSEQRQIDRRNFLQRPGRHYGQRPTPSQFTPQTTPAQPAMFGAINGLAYNPATGQSSEHSSKFAEDLKNSATVNEQGEVTVDPVSLIRRSMTTFGNDYAKAWKALRDQGGITADQIAALHDSAKGTFGGIGSDPQLEQFLRGVLGESGAEEQFDIGEDPFGNPLIGMGITNAMFPGAALAGAGPWIGRQLENTKLGRAVNKFGKRFGF